MTQELQVLFRVAKWWRTFSGRIYWIQMPIYLQIYVSFTCFSSLRKTTLGLLCVQTLSTPNKWRILQFQLNLRDVIAACVCNISQCHAGVALTEHAAANRGAHAFTLVLSLWCVGTTLLHFLESMLAVNRKYKQMPYAGQINIKFLAFRQMANNAHYGFDILLWPHAPCCPPHQRL
jgi:hypothetical protein